MRPCSVEECRHDDDLQATADRPRARRRADHHRKRHEPKIAADGAFGGVQLLNYRALPHITHVHSLSIHPTCNGMQSIELNLQTGSRECMFTARNESISASCRKMRFFTNNFSDIPS